MRAKMQPPRLRACHGALGNIAFAFATKAKDQNLLSLAFMRVNKVIAPQDYRALKSWENTTLLSQL